MSGHSKRRAVLKKWTKFFPIRFVKSFYTAVVKKSINFVFLNFSFDESKIGHVWVRWKARFKLYLLSIFQLGHQKKLRQPESIVRNGTKLALGPYKKS